MNNNINQQVIEYCDIENKRKIGLLNNNLTNLVSNVLTHRYIKLGLEFNITLYEKLKKLDISIDIFSHYLQNTKSMVCGSYLLSCLFNEEYKYNYINIYTNSDNKYLEEQFEFYLTKNKNYIDSYEDTARYNFKSMVDIDKIITYSMTNMKIRVIHIKPKLSIVDFVEENFDLSFTKTIYDGKNIYIYDKDTLDKIGNFSNKKLSNFNKKMSKLYTYRVYKYLERGFTTENQNELIRLST